MATVPTWDDYPIPDNLPTPEIRDPALPLVSVVTPSYNQGAFIRETIESVLTQDYPNLEYWVIDGGSTDETLDVLRDYDHDPRFHWLSEPDEGQSDAINKGFVRTHGSIWAWLNSDDSYLPAAVPRAVEHFTERPAIDLVYGNVQIVNEKGDPFGVHRGEDFNLKKLITDQLSIPQPSTFFRRESLLQIGPLRIDLNYAMDVDLWIRLGVSGLQLEYLPCTLARFRMHANSKSVSASPAFWAEHAEILAPLLSHPDYTKWERLALSNLNIYQGRTLAIQGERSQALEHLWLGLKLNLWRPRSLLIALMIVDALFGWDTWRFATTIKRRLQHDEVPEWQQLLQ